MTSDLTQRAADVLHARIGLKPQDSFSPRLTHAIDEVARVSNLAPSQLVAALTSDPVLLEALVDRMTVQETAFFRHADQFDVIRRVLVPTMTSPVSAWSAACANGQEAYSLAMLLDETCGGSVLATDVSHQAVLRTREGRYGEREMGGISPSRRARHFVASPDGWQVGKHLRQMVRVRQHNLLDQVPPEVADCQLVMCRNVLIYFSQASAAEFLVAWPRRWIPIHCCSSAAPKRCGS